MINGEFAIFIYDNKKKRYFLFRDRWGINNVYYTIRDGNLFFASEIKTLIFSPPKVNKKAFVEYMTFQFSISPHTIVDSVHTLRP
jgi:asparagine synthase (glutamine-hydrolysing)